MNHYYYCFSTCIVNFVFQFVPVLVCFVFLFFSCYCCYFVFVHIIVVITQHKKNVL